MDWAVVVVTGAGRGALVAVGRGAVVAGAAEVVVDGATVVVVLGGAVVDDAATGNSVAATCIVAPVGGPAGVAPAHVEAPTSAAANSGLAMTGFMGNARIER